MPVGKSNGLHRRQVHAQGFCIVRRPDFGKSRIEQERVSIVSDRCPDDGGKAVFRQDGFAKLAVLEGQRPGDDFIVVHGGQIDDLRAAGFPPEVIEAVDILTKREGESRLDAAVRASRNPVARIVKLADVEDNMDLRRIADPTEKDYDRLKEYDQVRALLEGTS